MDNYIVIGLVIATIEIIKTFPIMKTQRGKLFVPILVFIAAGLFNTANGVLFNNANAMIALKEGLYLGAISGGLYSMGQTYLDKSKK